MRNVEIKANVSDFDALFARAKDLCAGQQPTLLRQHDTFFDSPNGRLKLREFIGVEESPSELIYYDRPDSEGPKLSEFVKVNVADAKSLKEALRLSMGIKGHVHKERYLFLYGQTRIHIDRVQDLGDFMELEVCLQKDQDVGEGDKIAHQLMEQLGIKPNDLVKGAYMDKLLA